MGGGRVGFGGIDGHRDTGFGSKVEALVGEGQVADDLVVEVLGAGAMGADVVRAPAPAELLTAGGQLADEVVKALVVGVLPSCGAKIGDGHVGGEVPVGVEAVGGAVEEGEPGKVGRAGWVAVEVRVERSAEVVGGEEV